MLLSVAQTVLEIGSKNPRICWLFKNIVKHISEVVLSVLFIELIYIHLINYITLSMHHNCKIFLIYFLNDAKFDCQGMKKLCFTSSVKQISSKKVSPVSCTYVGIPTFKIVWRHLVIVFAIVIEGTAIYGLFWLNLYAQIPGYFYLVLFVFRRTVHHGGPLIFVRTKLDLFFWTVLYIKLLENTYMYPYFRFQ